MGTKVKITNRNGLQAINGDSGLDVEPRQQNIGFTPFAQYGRQVNTSEGPWTPAWPGFWFVSGSTLAVNGCTGTLPAASTQPGAEYDLVCNNINGFSLSGSNQVGVLGQMPAFHMIFSQTIGQGAQRGNNVRVPGGGSIHLKSTGFQYLITAASGTLLINA